ncbi:MAG TPA: AAA family ATPase [Nitrosomonas sp.]|nr:AAA family ATPase [Nitrosomonas sp.]
MTQGSLVVEDQKVTDSVRPAIFFETITFSDNQTLTFDDDEIVVFVGPNNTGKSETLRQLQNWISKSLSQTIVTNTTTKKIGTSKDLQQYLESNALKTGDINNFAYGGIGYNIHHSHVPYFDRPDRSPVAPFFSARLATEIRITASDPAGAIALYQQPPSHPIHLLLMDPTLGNEISDLFRRAFGKDLIVFRAGGSQFPLYVGTKPHREQHEDELHKSYVERLQSMAQPLQLQGDGMRSFATVLLYVLAADNHSIQFLDEPEAFLHPPQARLLGEYIAKNRRAKSQLFIATHSTDILDGLIAGGNSKVRIIRMQRIGKINYVKELSKEKTAAIANDTLTQYSGVFKGIFYRHVIIAESDSDCLFYNALLNTKSVSGDLQPDVLFIHAAGKHRIVQLAETLKLLAVPISVIADIDILNEETTFRTLYEKLCGNWEDISNHWRSIKNSIEALNPPINADQVKSLLLTELGNVSGVGKFPKETERNIKNIFKSLSPWDNVKHVGRNALRGAETIKHFDQLVEKCSAKGLWIVKVGELEGFCRSIDARHGPAFAEKVIEELDLEQNEELEEARKFVRDIWNSATTSVIT